jgi:uracil-DNA glycosylase
MKPWIHPRHKIIMTVHPSPLSAYRGFFDSQLFIKINQALKELALSPVDFDCFD